MEKKRILIVEDEESLLKLESILLSSRGYAVAGVTDGKAALDYIAATPPDLIILDIMLPGMDGFEVCRLIKADPSTRHIPVVMLTAKKSTQDREKGMDAGAAAYVTKPFKSARIIEIIQGLLAA
ncbi:MULTISPECIES: response regulator transcription factor [Geobacter]|uniref:Chemotaxis protein CheY n=2 Tax=Geobacter TaxID=28231 RepID=A0A0C1QMI4_9BACT|nr:MULTISPECIES: response regulator [Geobacter]ANA39984.1 two-component system response regulator [Geobacter anodireducens]KIE41837.1 chemotaxis protein CheY [Geobacter soli]MBE2887974.1 response regulator [Geobacter anodireducens]HMN01420.1 response regulator [Geobacter anodireducens]